MHWREEAFCNLVEEVLTQLRFLCAEGLRATGDHGGWAGPCGPRSSQLLGAELTLRLAQAAGSCVCRGGVSPTSLA